MPKKTQKKKKAKAARQPQEVRPKDFLDIIAPAAVKFNTDHYICGSMYHCIQINRSNKNLQFSRLLFLHIILWLYRNLMK